MSIEKERVGKRYKLREKQIKIEIKQLRKKNTKIEVSNRKMNQINQSKNESNQSIIGLCDSVLGSHTPKGSADLICCVSREQSMGLFSLSIAPKSV